MSLVELLDLPELEMGRGRSKLILIASCSDSSEGNPPYSIHRCSIPVAVQSSWPKDVEVMDVG
jgi:hypothetical protein